jgi:hypothetical protein
MKQGGIHHRRKFGAFRFASCTLQLLVEAIAFCHLDHNFHDQSTDFLQ